MKRLLSFLIVLSLVAFAGYKAAVWWLVDQRLAEARTELSEFGVLERGSIGSSLDGRVLLSGARWLDFKLTQPLALGVVELDAGSPIALLTALANPESLGGRWQLAIEQASMTLEPTMFRNWVTEGADEESASTPLVALACAPDPRQHLGSGDLKRMGIDAVAGDFLLVQSPDGFRAELYTVETGSLEVNWPGVRVRPGRTDIRLDNNGSSIANVTLRDAGLMRRLSAYCSRETGLTLNEWSVAAAKALARGLEDRGYKGSSQLLALYRQWLTEGGELSFTLDPDSDTLGIPVRTDEESDTAWQVIYNGAKVPDVYLTEVLPVVPDVATEAPELPVQPENPNVAQWYAEPVENANLWLGRKVRVTLSNDNQVEGKLVSVGDRELEVSRMLAGGEMAYPMLIRAVAQFEVWRRGRTD
ncbi:acetylornithine deacetylase [Marinobacter sp.]|uniref:acetylornithine deacetylase n=1 Tax=Marinobacter sp. TaxID=50741 RepID=UPI00356B3496